MNAALLVERKKDFNVAGVGVSVLLLERCVVVVVVIPLCVAVASAGERGLAIGDVWPPGEAAV